MFYIFSPMELNSDDVCQYKCANRQGQGGIEVGSGRKKAGNKPPAFFYPAANSLQLSILGAVGIRYIGFDGLFIANFQRFIENIHCFIDLIFGDDQRWRNHQSVIPGCHV